MCNALLRPLFSRFTSAPLSISRFTIASWPAKHIEQVINYWNTKRDALNLYSNNT